MTEFLPEADAFHAAYRAGKPQVVWTTLVADLETPVSAFLKLTQGRDHAFLLESVEGGAIRGRYSIIGLMPDIIWRCQGDKALINRHALTDPEAFVPEALDPLGSMRALIAESLIDLPDSLPPMAAGLVGYMGYDMVRLMEKLPSPNPDPLGLPDGLFVRPTLMAVFDSVKDVVMLVTPVRPQPDLSADAAYSRAQDRLWLGIDALDRAVPSAHSASLDVVALPEPVSNTPQADYMGMVRKAQEYIAAGDIFQVVLSQRFSLPFDLPPFALYRALRRTNPSPYMYYMDFGCFSVIGSSPEILVRLRDGEVTIRPIAGTRPRGANAEEDKALMESLLSDPKELSEHLMLLDLGRNDVGRVAKPGTVEVTEQNTIEYYSHVMHIVSNVRGQIDPAHDGIDALCGGFPAGTVSGAPKVRAMEIIDELEVEKRGVYGGGVGYFSAGGAMDTAIVLRTAVVKDGIMYVQAGAGIVADSVPESEDAECRAKARALIRAAQEAVHFAAMPGRGQ
ncbi:anthranilate synthase component I [Iodidimonas sp. SYSU 1G8]|uniref:anthranilate synthase component I n=1 Tax=Iodidimonas sp. SYSU 1G8 TaxID=3133967 RepID=UPI0031FEC721